MIEIITRAGISLDLTPDALFEIELENPMLADEHIPVAYSTSISFLPTFKNKQVFGYLPAMLLEPQVKEVAVSIQVQGIPLFFGTLVYDGIEEGNINYSFSGRNLEDDWSGYIHSLSHLSEKKFEYKADTPLSCFAEWWTYYAEVKNNVVNTDFEFPTLVGAANITDIEHKNDIPLDKVDVSVKYRNYPYVFCTLCNPAIKVANILSKALMKTSISPLIAKRYESLAILGMYKKSAGNFEWDDLSINLVLRVADYLPECTISSLVKNVLKMFCATLYRDGAGFKIITNKEILESDNVIDWGNKITDSYTLSTEKKQGYTFHFNNDGSENTGVTETSDTLQNGASNIINVQSISEVLETSATHSEYVAMRHIGTGDIYSGKKVMMWNWISNSPGYTMPYLDMVLHKLEKYNTDEGESNYDNAIDFHLVRCLPTKILPLGSSDMVHYMCPIIQFPAAETERTSDIWIGTLMRGQMVDKGRVFDDPTVTEPKEYVDEELSLDPTVLYNTYHKEFASWLAQDRRVVTCDVYLTPQEIAALRMYHKVSIYSQEFFIKKLSFTFSANSNHIGTRGDFISATRK